MFNRRFIILGSIILILSLWSRISNTAELKPQIVQDLRYGQALFHFYQQKYFAAMTDLMVAVKTQPISHQGDDPALLMGGLMLAYGMHNEASRRFKAVLDGETLPGTHDRIWYYIAKLRYQAGRLDEAEQALNQIKGTLPANREAERLHLLANTYLAQQQYDKAIDVLDDFNGDSEWEAYAQFNLGVALIKTGQVERGTNLLSDIGEISLVTANQEFKALRDKANLAMGYTYIKYNDPNQAMKYIRRIRLNGPLSNKALLGMGWAQTSLQNYKQALIPWMELRGRHALNSAVQESLLAIPYTLEMIQSKHLALEYYNEAVNTYAKEISRLDNVFKAIKNGELLKAMRPANISDETSLPRHTFGLPNSITVPYLIHLMATQEFQGAYKNYQNLLHLQYILSHWQNQLPAYTLMLEERRKSYTEKLSKIAKDDRLHKINKLRSRRDKLVAKIAYIESEQDGLALALDDEMEHLQLLGEVKHKLQQLAPHQDLSEEQDKYRLIKGILYWQIQTDYIPRLWEAKKGLKEIDKALSKAKASQVSLVRGAQQAPKTFKGFDKLIKYKRRQILNLQQKLGTVITEHERYINNLALSALKQRQHNLENYHVRARFSLARLLDSLAGSQQEISRAQP